MGVDILLLPFSNNENSFSLTHSGQIHFVSPTGNKILKMVFENEKLDLVGTDACVSSVSGIMFV